MKKIKNFLKRNLKYSIAFIIGILVHLVVYASTTPLYTSNQIGYDNSNSGLAADNVKDALDVLYNKAATCDFGSGESSKTVDDLNVGDYITYVPSLSTATVTAAMTGYSTDQTISPNELTLWRVLQKTNNGIEIISNNISDNNGVYFYGIVGYQNYVGSLNVIASFYENSSYTNGSRYFGYNGQTEYIQNELNWTNGHKGEQYGGGDELYTSDLNLLNTFVDSMDGVYGVKNNMIFMASRYYYDDMDQFRARKMLGGELVNDGSMESLYIEDRFEDNVYGNLLPVVYLKNSLTFSGSGTSSDPYVIQ